jgi:hypothetical protein
MFLTIVIFWQLVIFCYGQQYAFVPYIIWLHSNDEGYRSTSTEGQSLLSPLTSGTICQYPCFVNTDSDLGLRRNK